jgi:hypothetical protein
MGPYVIDRDCKPNQTELGQWSIPNPRDIGQSDLNLGLIYIKDSIGVGEVFRKSDGAARVCALSSVE